MEDLNKKYRDRLKKKHPEYDLVDEFEIKQLKGTIVKMKHYCGSIVQKKLTNLMNSKNMVCKNCLEIRRLKTFVKALEDEEYELLDKNVKGIKNNKEMHGVKHIPCGREFKSNINRFIDNNMRCPDCALIERGRRRIDPNHLENMMKKISDASEYKWLEDYVNNKTKLDIKHLTCGYTYKVRPNDFQQGYRCPKCYITRVSNLTAICLDTLDNLGVSYEIEYSFDALPNSRFDIRLENGILIEIDGEQHFDCRRASGIFDEKYLSKIIKRDSTKNNYVWSNSLKLLRIKYDIDINYLRLLLTTVSIGSLDFSKIPKSSKILIMNGNETFNLDLYYSNKI